MPQAVENFGDEEMTIIPKTARFSTGSCNFRATKEWQGGTGERVANMSVTG